MGVEIKYKGNQIASMAESGTKTLKTSGAYCEGDITVEYEKPVISDVVSGTKDITTNGEHDVAAYAVAKVNVPVPSGYIKPSGTKNITENGTHDVTSYASTNVNVPIPSGYIKPSGTKSVTTNGTHDVTSYSSVEVAVPVGTQVSGTKSITSNGEHDVSSYAKANVNVPIPSGYIKPSGTKTVSENGTFDISSFASVVVDVKSIADKGKLFEVNLTSNSPTGWNTLISSDSDIKAHKDSSALIAILQYMDGGKSGVGYIPFAMTAANGFTADDKSSLYLYQKNTDATAASSSNKRLRTKTAARGVMYIDDNGNLMYYVDSASYPLIAGRYIITVLW